MSSSVGVGGQPTRARNQDATVYVGQLDERVDEKILWELFVQVGPIADVSMPKDELGGGAHRG